MGSDQKRSPSSQGIRRLGRAFLWRLCKENRLGIRDSPSPGPTQAHDQGGRGARAVAWKPHDNNGALSSTFTPVKKAPSQKGEGARGLSGWLNNGPKAKLPCGSVRLWFPLLWRYGSANHHVTGVGVSRSSGHRFRPRATWTGRISHMETDFDMLPRYASGVQGHLNCIRLVWRRSAVIV